MRPEVIQNTRVVRTSVVGGGGGGASIYFVYAIKKKKKKKKNTETSDDHKPDAKLSGLCHGANKQHPPLMGGLRRVFATRSNLRRSQGGRMKLLMRNRSKSVNTVD